MAATALYGRRLKQLAFEPVIICKTFRKSFSKKLIFYFSSQQSQHFLSFSPKQALYNLALDEPIIREQHIRIVS